MTDEQAIVELREAGRTLAASALLLEIRAMLPGGISQGSMITLLKRAFPEIPLSTLLEAGAWHRVSHGGMTDDELDVLLGAWLPRKG